MSKGSKVVPVRFTNDLLVSVEQQISASNAIRSGQPWTFSEFVRVAVREKLAKMLRSRSKAKAPTHNGD